MGEYSMNSSQVTLMRGLTLSNARSVYALKSNKQNSDDVQLSVAGSECVILDTALEHKTLFTDIGKFMQANTMEEFCSLETSDEAKVEECNERDNPSIRVVDKDEFQAKAVMPDIDPEVRLFECAMKTLWKSTSQKTRKQKRQKKSNEKSRKKRRKNKNRKGKRKSTERRKNKEKHRKRDNDENDNKKQARNKEEPPNKHTRRHKTGKEEENKNMDVKESRKIHEHDIDRKKKKSRKRNGMDTEGLSQKKKYRKPHGKNGEKRHGKEKSTKRNRRV